MMQSRTEFSQVLVYRRLQIDILVYLQAPIRRVLLMPAGIANSGFHDPRDAAELRLGEPKSSHSKSGRFSHLRNLVRTHDLSRRCCC